MKFYSPRMCLGLLTSVIFLWTVHLATGQSVEKSESETLVLIARVRDIGESLPVRIEAAKQLGNGRKNFDDAKSIFIQMLYTPLEHPLALRQTIATVLSNHNPSEFSTAELESLRGLIQNEGANGDIRVALFGIFLRESSTFSEIVVDITITQCRSSRTKARFLESLRYRTSTSPSLQVRNTVRSIFLNTSEDPEIRYQAGIFFRFAQDLQPGELDRWEAVVRNKGEHSKIRIVALQALYAQRYNPERLATLLTSLLSQIQEAPDLRVTALDIAGSSDVREDFKSLIYDVAVSKNELPGIRSAAFASLEKISPLDLSRTDKIRSITSDISTDAQIRFSAVKYVANRIIQDEEERERFVSGVLDISTGDPELRKSLLYYMRDQHYPLSDETLELIVTIAAGSNEPVEVRRAAIAPIDETRLGAVKLLPRLAEVLSQPAILEFGRPEEKDLYVATMATIEEIAGAGIQNESEEVIQALDQVEESMQRRFDGIDSTEINTFRRNIAKIKSRAQEIRDKGINAVLIRAAADNLKLVLLIGGVAFWIIGWFVVLFILSYASPQRLFRFHLRLRELGRKTPLQGTHGMLLLSPMCGWIIGRDRVLSSWVAMRIDHARQKFTSIDSVKERSKWVRINVDWSGRNLTPTASWIREPLTTGTDPLVIYGQGGVGKSSLAFQVAKWALGIDADVVMSPMIPVLIEGSVEYSGEPNVDGFLEFVGGKIRALVGETETIDVEIVALLLKWRKILLIVDGYSEMTEESRRRVFLYENQVPINSVIVTSRGKEFSDNLHRTIKAPPLEKAAVGEFLENYLKQDGRDRLFDELGFQTICKRLSEVVGGRSITPLVAKLYAEHCVRTSKDESTENIASVADLFVDYVTHSIMKFEREMPVSLEFLISFLKEIAWQCTRESFRAGAMSRAGAKRLATASEVADAAGGEAGIERVLDFLTVRCGLLTAHGGATGVSFQQDPAAEYLAALHLVGVHGADSDLLETMQAVERELAQRVRVGDFALALVDCVRSVHPLAERFRELCSRLETASIALRVE